MADVPPGRLMLRRSVAARAAVGLPLALLLFVASAVVPPAAAPVAPFVSALGAPVALAADGLDVGTDARYVVMPDQALVHVTVQLEVRNDTPDQTSGGVITYYSYFDGVNVGVQPEATHLTATQDGVAVSLHVTRKTGYRLVAIDFHTNLRYQRTTTVVLAFDLPAGKPRSSSDVRVGPAFATFLAWAFGDRGTVRVEVPARFTVDVTGESLARTRDGATTILTASTTDPLRWYAWINARNDAGLSSQDLDIEGGEQIIVRGWPEDAVWRGRVADVLTSSVPELVSRIGLPWPVDGPLSVIEIHAPLLEGYAGFYDPTSDQITISEALDDLTIIHEASHAWFSPDLFSERWITEGLADEYASRVLTAIGGDGEAPGAVTRTDPAAFPLNSWPPPAAIQDDQSAAKEKYGYDASWFVVRQVVAAVGEDGMRRVFAAAHDHTTAYVGGTTPERAFLPNDWRRFVDLTEELGGAHGVAALVQAWALPAGFDSILRERAVARDAYHALLAASHGWVAPYVVRSPLDAWQFAAADDRISEAAAILRQRDETAELAAQEQLTPPADLRPMYEHAAELTGLAAAAALATDTEASLEKVAAADEVAAAPRDWLVSLGLDGHDPDGDLTAARAAWSSGDLETANARATLVMSVLAAAPGAGRDRAVGIGIGSGAVLALLILAIVLLRRRSRRRAVAGAAILPLDGSGPTGWPQPPAPPVPPAPTGSSWVLPVAPPATPAWPVSTPSPADGPPTPSPADGPSLPPPPPGAPRSGIEAGAERTDRYGTLPPSAPPGPDPGPGSIDDRGAGP